MSDKALRPSLGLQSSSSSGSETCADSLAENSAITFQYFCRNFSVVRFMIKNKINVGSLGAPYFSFITWTNRFGIFSATGANTA